jgi:LuxR family transcriptional regulator, maltose regulon positive regulatory protein
MAEPPTTTASPAATAERDVLLATKLHLPRTRPGFVARPRLADRLTPAHGRELTLVCAPAGFGKTALLADWASGSGRPVAWLSLDAGDNDPARFWRHVAAALDGMRPGIAARVAALLQGLQPTSFEAVVATLVNELAGVAEEVVLVLDDYHLIQAPAVHESVGFLLEHLPASLRLVVASRVDPPLPLARLRARGQLVELREHDLRFTEAEAAELLGAAVGAELPEGAVAALTARTEGWAAGLQLAALSLQGRSDIGAFVEGFSGSHRYVLDYLAEEVLDRQPEPLRTFLLESSVPERLCGPLCDAVTGRADSQQLLEQVERANLFLVPLDDVRGWWRFHRLFADLLQARLRQERPEREPELHRAAAAWFEAHGLAEEAVRHALAAGEAGWVARLMEQHFPGLLWVSQDPTLSRWLTELPPSVVREPWLCVALASQAAMGGRLEEAERLLVAAERAPAGGAATPGPPAATPGPRAGAAVRLAEDLPSVIAMNRANFARLYGDPGPATRFAHQAQAELAGDDPLTRAVIDWNLTQADLLGGRLEGVEPSLRRVMAAYRAAGVPLLAAGVCYDLAQVQHALGRLGAAITTCHQALELAGAVDPELSPAAAAHARLAELLRERDELDAALDHATRGVALCRQHEFAWPLAVALPALAWIRQAQGDPDGAWAAMTEAERALPDPRVVDLFNPAPAQAARLALAQGRVEDAARFVRGRGLGPEDEPSYPREREHLVLARVLMAQGEPQRALGLLARLHAAAAAQGRTGSVIQVRALQALARSASGDHAGALDALAEALALGAPEGWLRVFVDEGPPMATLARKLLVDRRQQRPAAAIPRDQLARLADAFERAGLPIRPPTSRGGVAAAGLVEPLTARELEVLELLAAGSPNRAIAERLVVTPETVKKHLSHLFGKLGVTNRTQAVARARELGLLP